MKKFILLIAILAMAATQSYATLALMPLPKVQFFDNNGNPLAGGKICTYVSGSSTPKFTYSDADGTTENTNPVILDAYGRATIYLDGTYKIKVMDKTQTDCATGTALYTSDPIDAMPYTVPADLISTEWVASGALATYVSTTQFSVTGDFTGTYEVGKRIKATATAGTLYGRVTDSTYVYPTTTVTVELDSGVLDSGISDTDIYVSLLGTTNRSVSFDSIASGSSDANLDSSGSNTWSGTQTVTGAIISSGNNTLSGSQTITGDINSSGVGTWTGANLFTALSTSNTLTVTGGIVTSGVITTSTDTTIAPFDVYSSVVNTNLNAGLVDGYSVSTAPSASTIPIYNSNKDLLDRNSTALFAPVSPTSYATGTTGSTTIGSIAVTSGDIIFAQNSVFWTAGASETEGIYISFTGVAGHWLDGSASGTGARTAIDATSGNAYRYAGTGILIISGSGTLTIGSVISGTSPTSVTNSIGYGFLKKQ
jgi:hypothetical protein